MHRNTSTCVMVAFSDDLWVPWVVFSSNAGAEEAYDFIWGYYFWVVCSSDGDYKEFIWGSMD